MHRPMNIEARERERDRQKAKREKGNRKKHSATDTENYRVGCVFVARMGCITGKTMWPVLHRAYK